MSIHVTSKAWRPSEPSPLSVWLLLLLAALIASLTTYLTTK